MIDYSRRILELDDVQLEKMVRAWVSRKKSTYAKVERFSGTGDLGRDVVGFVTTQLHDGPWDNFQCKQYGSKLGTGEAVREVGKILYYSFNGAFTIPRKYHFVAPRGVNRNLSKLLHSPVAFKQYMFDHWSDHCETQITETVAIPLNDELRAHIETFDFSTIEHVSLDTLTADADFKPVAVEWFGADPGPAPKGVVPATLGATELSYVGQLVDAYSEREDSQFAGFAAAEAHSTYGPHLHRQRERFYDADAFLRFYRDNTSAETIDGFTSEVYHGVVEVYEGAHADSLARADAVMTQAASVHPSGPLASHARVPVKQGVCHHFANDDRMKWKK